MPRLAPAKPRAWPIHRADVAPNGRRFWPLAICVPLWHHGPGYVLRDFGYSGMVFKYVNNANPRVAASLEGNENIVRDGDQGIYTDLGGNTDFLQADNVPVRLTKYPFSIFWRGGNDLNGTGDNTVFSIGRRYGVDSGLPWFSIIADDTGGGVYKWSAERNNGSGGQLITGTTSLSATRIDNVCVVFYSDTLFKLFVNGVEEANGTTSISFPSSVLTACMVGGNSAVQFRDAIGPHLCAYVFPWALAVSEIAMLERDPYLPIRQSDETLAALLTIIEQEGFRFYNDDGGEAAATAIAGQDVDLVRNTGVSAILRILLNATGDPAAAKFKIQYQKNGDVPWKDV